MSKNTNTSPAMRWQLLSTVSAIAIVASVYTASEADAASNDADRPLIWLELGGQAELASGFDDPFVPPFLMDNPTSPVFQSVTPQQAQKLPPFSFGEDGKISFQPEDSDWIFSAAIRYGRSSSRREIEHQTKGVGQLILLSGKPYGNFYTLAEFSDTKARNQESHAVIDFSVGKDVGLGLFGSDGTSQLNAGVRFAQFSSSAALDMRARPDMHFKYFPSASATSFREKLPYYYSYHAAGHVSRNFHGVGPAISWNGTAPIAGNSQGGGMALDWAVNAAILFGRQKAHVRHQQTARYMAPLHCLIHSCYRTAYVHPSSGHPTFGHDTNRSITVPNVGASLGISFRKGDAKVSFGYRADLFMGAMDVGIDARKSSNVLFHGPYASISIGLGD